MTTGLKNRISEFCPKDVATPSIPLLRDDGNRSLSDFERLDHRFEDGQRESIVALREIRQRKLFKEQFVSFDDYMAARGRTRQWATQQINWLRRQELLEEFTGQSAGKGPYQLSVDEAQKLGPLVPPDDLGDDETELYCQMFVESLVEAQEAAEAARTARTAKMTERAVKKRVKYIENRKTFGDDLTLDDSFEIDRLAGHSHEEISTLLASARERAEQEGRPSTDCLRELVEEILKAGKNEGDADEPRQPTAELTVVADEPIPTTVSDRIPDDIEGDGILIQERKYDVALDGDFAKVIGSTSATYSASELADLFTNLGVEITCERVGNGGITVSLADSE